VSDLIEKLSAVLDEHERIARATVPRGMRAEDDKWTASDFAWPLGSDHAGFPDEDDLAHIVTQQPKHTLAVIAAHRKVLELHEPRTHDVRAFVPEADRNDSSVAYEPTGAVSYTACPTCGGRDWDLERFATWEPCDTVLALAEAYGIEV